jgi:hypothetical protein
MEDTMSDFLRKISSSSLKILWMGCLTFLLAAPALAQDQGQKGQAPPPAATPKPGPKPKMAPAPVPQQERAAEEGFVERQEKTFERKKATGKVGGQEIRSKKGEEGE